MSHLSVSTAQERLVGLNIIVVGGGIAGLCAAIGLRKAGHSVRLFERTATATAFGAGVVIGYNASKVLTAWDFDYLGNHVDVAEDFVMLKGDTLEEMVRFDPKEYETLAEGHRQYYAHRVDLQDALVKMAVQPDGQGAPVEMIYSSSVSSYDADGGNITLEDGSNHTADFVVAADGVHSLAPRCMLDSNDIGIAHTGTTIIRFMLPSDSILFDSKTASLIEHKGRFSWFVGPDRQRWLLQYPVRNNTEQNYGMYSRVNNDHEVDEQEFRFKCDQSSLKRELSGFNESILALVPKTSKIMPLWKLPERPPLPTWYRGKLLVIGDAAHAMLPNQGQGAGMCIEDAGALSVLFSQMPNTSKPNVAERLRLFDYLRRPRASVVQIISHYPYFEDAVKLSYSELIKYLPPEKLPEISDRGAIRRWLFSYDVLRESRKLLQQHLNAD